MSVEIPSASAAMLLYLKIGRVALAVSVIDEQPTAEGRLALQELLVATLVRDPTTRIHGCELAGKFFADYPWARLRYKLLLHTIDAEAASLTDVRSEAQLLTAGAVAKEESVRCLVDLWRTTQSPEDLLNARVAASTVIDRRGRFQSFVAIAKATGLTPDYLAAFRDANTRDAAVWGDLLRGYGFARDLMSDLIDATRNKTMTHQTTFDVLANLVYINPGWKTEFHILLHMAGMSHA